MPRHDSLSSSTVVPLNSKQTRSRSIDGSDLTYPSVDSQARYDSPNSNDSSTIQGRRRPSVSPTGILSVVTSFRSVDTHDWRNDIAPYSPFGELPSPRRAVFSDIISPRHGGDALLDEVHPRDRLPRTDRTESCDRSASTATDGEHHGDTGSSMTLADRYSDEQEMQKIQALRPRI